MYANTSIFNKIIYFTCIPLVWSIIYVVVSCFTTYFYLNIMAMEKNPIMKNIISLIFYFCAFMTIFCHTKSIFTDPGIIEEEKLKKLKKEEKTYCKKCDKERPLRAHHCSTCNKCILKLDHHCPWIYNCVGYYNQKTFFLFLFSGTLGDLIAFICIGLRILHPSFNYMLISSTENIQFEEDDSFIKIFFQISIALKHPLWIIFGTVLSFGMTVGIGVLFYTQFNNIIKNITTCEDTIFNYEDECPYYCNKGYRFFMFKTILGMENIWKWFFPIFEENKFNGGYTFDTPYKRIVKKKNKNKTQHEHHKICWKYCFCCPC